MLELFGGPPWYGYSLAFILAFGAVSLPLLFFVTAPYGRHVREGWGPSMNALLAWLVMEAPAPVLFAAVFFSSPEPLRPVPLILLGLWMAHYLYRAFVFPFRMRGIRQKTKPVLTVLLAFLFNCANGAVNAYAITELAPHLTTGWLADPRFALGVLLFAVGYGINHQSDAILRGLRKPGETGYKVPHGGLFRWVTSPNYLGEIIEWIGFALAAWTLPGAAFVFFSVANLLPRAVAHHRWYHEKFDDYPSQRRALLPFLL